MKIFDKCYKPYDIVSHKDGSVGFIQEVSINRSQSPDDNAYVQYAVRWIYGSQTVFAWFSQDELKKHCNLFEEIAKASCHPVGHSASDVSRIMRLT